MGKYSLENYEIYKTKKIRPDLLKTAPDNWGRGKINYVTCSWALLEPYRGDYRLDFLDEISKTFNPVLMIRPDLPNWMTENPEECFSVFIRRMGSYVMMNHIPLTGVVITTISNSTGEWNGYVDGFKSTTLFADLDSYELIQFLRDKNQSFGIRISCREGNWIECCEDLAVQSLQNHWETNPVLLHVLDESCGPHVKRQSLQWHAAFSNRELDLGFSIALRRLTYPEEVSGGGALPIRFWFVNSGSSPCYHKLSIQLKLSQEDNTFVISLLNSPSHWHVGDIIHNEMVQLKGLSAGIYSLSVGVFYDDVPVYMGMNQRNENGFYTMGEIKVDQKDGDSLKNVWDHYYPEGYYPLEDPGSPE